MRSHFYTTSKTAWSAMLRAIACAKKSVYLEMYIFEDSTAGHDFIAALVQAAERGVRVVAILDAYGSSKLSEYSLARLRLAGIEVLYFSYWFRRTHRKLLITDERRVFLGGVNISSRFSEWNDLQVELHGPVARAATVSFARVYRTCGGKDAALLNRATVSPALNRARQWFVEHGLVGKRLELKHHYTEHIDRATKAIVLITPYFIPKHWLISALHRAIARGVSVLILLPQRTEFRTVDRLNRYYGEKFSALGAQVLFFEDMNHAKAMVVDEEVAVVGSQNLDALSFHWNVEGGVFFSSPAMVRDLLRIIGAWKDRAVALHQFAAAPRWYDSIVLWFVRFLEPVL